MDTSKDPCNDFYAFTCGNWAHSNNIVAGIQTMNTFSLLQIEIYNSLKKAFEEKLTKTNLPPAQRKLLDAYRSCINNKNVEGKDIMELQDLLKEVGGWPMADTQWNENEYDIDIGIAIAIRKTGQAPLVGFGVLPDIRNTTRNVITLSVPNTITGFAALKSLLKEMAQQFPNYSSDKFESDMLEIISLENELQKIIANSPKTHEEDTKQYKIKELKTIIKGVDFIEFFQVITNSSLNNMNEFLTEDDEIAVTNMEYLKNLAKLIESKDSLRVFANYIGAQIILASYSLLIATLPPHLRYIYQQQRLAYFRAPEAWMPCIVILSTQLTYLTDRMYIDYLGESSKADEKGKKMIDHISQAFETLATESDWLDNDTLSAVKEKLHNMRKHIGYADWILEDKKLENYYSLLPTMDSRFSANVKIIAEFTMGQWLRKLRVLNNLNEWPDLPGITTTMVNAFYILPYNSIYFPIAIQNPPFYDKDFPWYLNFGAIGAVIGHEITHGFDSKGRFLDKNGNIHNWWSEKAKNIFNQKSECFVNQYNNYYDSRTNQYVNGTLTLGENIADNGGLRQAYLAYKTWEKEFGNEQSLPGLEHYTPYQLLFIAYGNMWCATFQTELLKELMKEDEHTPSPYRVWGAISNSKEFVNTFNCTKGTKMNPENKCIIW